MKTRRRGRALEVAILTAAVEEMRVTGYAALTMDRVAARACTNKNTLYRRWPNKASLAVDAYLHLVRDRRAAPDTGSLRKDVIEQLSRLNGEAPSPAADLHRALVAGIGSDPELRARLVDEAVDGSAGLWLQLLGRAVARGELTPGVLHARVATVAVVLLRNEYLTRGAGPVSRQVIEEIVDEVYLPLLRGRAGAAAATAAKPARSTHKQKPAARPAP